MSSYFSKMFLIRWINSEAVCEIKLQALLVDMRSTEKLSHNHVEAVVYHHGFAVHSRASFKRDTQKPKLGLILNIEWCNIHAFIAGNLQVML